MLSLMRLGFRRDEALMMEASEAGEILGMMRESERAGGSVVYKIRERD